MPSPAKCSIRTPSSSRMVASRDGTARGEAEPRARIAIHRRGWTCVQHDPGGDEGVSPGADVKTGRRGRAIVKGGCGSAARSVAVLGAMLQFAAHRKLIATNPAKGVPLLKGEKKGRFLSEAEVKRLAEAVFGMEAERKLSSTAAVAIGLLMLRGVASPTFSPYDGSGWISNVAAYGSPTAKPALRWCL